MAMLPRFITLMHNSNFFQYETQRGENHATLQATSPTIISDNNFTKLEVVSSRVQGMVHIRTCYNNKFLQLNPSPTGFRFVFYATADEPEEDRSNRQCTLFRPSIIDGRVSFSHQAENILRPVVVYTGNSFQVGSSGQPFWFIFRDMSKLAILPKHVVFKGDDGNYLRARKGRWLMFVANDPQDWRVHHISTMVPSTGDVRLLSPRFDLYWERVNNDWLRCDANNQNVVNSTFRPVRQSSNIRGNTIALLNTGNNRYCQRLTSGSNAGYIRANASNIPANALLTVEEAIRDREISNIRYHVDDARVYNVIPLESLSQQVVNRGHQTAYTEVGFSYKEVREEMFSSSHSWKLSYKSTVTVRLIPKIVEGKVTINASYSGKVEWSETNRTEQTITSRTIVPVPPRSVITVTLIVGQGSMNVPFSYKQRDVLMDGSVDVKDMHDGLFSGLNTFDLHYDTGEPGPLPSNDTLPLGQDDNDIVIVPGEITDLPCRMDIPRVVDDLKLEVVNQGEKAGQLEEEDQGKNPMPSKL